MNPGSLHEIVDIQAATPTKDGAGGAAVVWATTVTAERAKIVALDPTKLIQEGKGFHGQSYRVTIRKDAFTFTDIGQVRIKWGDDFLKIITFVNKRQSMRDRWWVLICEDTDGTINN